MNQIIPSLRKSSAFQLLILVTLLPGLMIFPLPLMSNPQGANVVHGNVNFQGMGTANLDINNMSNRAIINWQSFSIQQGETTRINQGGSAFTLNRVTSGDPSAIYGQLRAANGGVLVINPNGIMVGPTGVIDVGGMVTLSTLDIDDEDFLDGGQNRFSGLSSAGVRNFGAVTSRNGDVVMLGNFLQNAGSVSAPDGVVAFGAGGDMVVEQNVDGSTISVLGAGPGGGTGIENTGEIDAAAAEFKAHGNVYALAIKNDGVVRAGGYEFSGGKLTLEAGRRGNIVNTGQLRARDRDGSGGRVSVSGDQVSLAGGSVDASGAPGRAGGSIDVSGEAVRVADSARVDASGSTGGSVSIEGGSVASVDGVVEARGDVGNGGSVDMTGESLNLGSTASVDVSGVAGGGRIRAGGGFQGDAADIENSRSTVVEEGASLIADASAGNAGGIAVWSDGDTLFRGEVSAQARGNVGNGGFVEVSGLESLMYFGSASTAAANGRTGRLLLDPTNVIIGTGPGATMSDTAVVDAVLNNNVVIHTASEGGEAGNIEVQAGANVVYDSPNSLAFFAHGSIFVNGDIKNHGTTDYQGGNTAGVDDGPGTGNITLFAGWDGTGADTFNFDPDDTGAGADGPTVSAADVRAGTFGSWGQNGGSVILNDAAVEPVEVGSARGETNAFGRDVSLIGGNTNGEFTQLGFRRENDLRGTARTASGTINTATDLDLEDGVVGDINVDAVRDVRLIPNSNSNSSDGIKTNSYVYTQIGHGGLRRNADQIDARGGTDYGSDSGTTSVGQGDNRGDISVNAGRALVMTAARHQTYAQVGHGGLGVNNLNGGAGTDVSDIATTDRDIFGDMSGDITVEAGVIDMEAGLYSDAPVMIGHGGRSIRGEHSGDISVNTTEGGILAEAAPESAIGGPGNSNDWRWRNNRNRSFAQIGHGGFDSDLPNGTILPRRNGVTLDTRNGIQQIDGTSVPGDGIRVNPETGESYRHRGDISVSSAAGIEFRAANGHDAHAMIGHGGRSTAGDHEGDIFVEAKNGSIIFDRDADQINERGRDITNRGDRAHAQIGHGGSVFNGGATGDIEVRATGDVEFYAGRNDAHAMVGHGGSGDTSSTWNNGRQRNRQANGTHSGDITLDAGGDVLFRGGFSNGTRSFAQVGHGGYFQNADIFDADGDGLNSQGLENLANTLATSQDQTGHNGDISVTSGGSLSFKAGADSLREGQTFRETNGTENWVQIGHGGRLSKGNHHGQIAVDAVEDIEMEARGGWNAVALDNQGGRSNEESTPRLDINHDNALVGERNWAQIGHGGHDATHDNSNTRDQWNNSGAEGIGLGLDFGEGESDIEVTAGGDFTMVGALEENAGPQLPINLIQDNGAGNPNIGNVLNTHFVQTPLFAGTADGLSGGVTIEADNFNDDTNGLVILEGDGTTDLDTLIADWNDANPGATVTLHPSSDGTQVLGAGAAIAISSFSTFGGTPAGASETVVIQADTPTTDPITLTGDGESTLNDLIQDWNDANPGNEITLEAGFGAGGDTIDDGEAIVVDGGIGPRPTPSQQFSQFDGRIETLVRDNGEVWDLPDPVLMADDSYAQIGHGGVASDYRGGVNGEGHRGDITVDVGGNMTMRAGDIEQSVSNNQALTIEVQNFQGTDGAGNVDPDVGSGTLGGAGQYFVGPSIGGNGDSGTFIDNDNSQNDPTQGRENFAQVGHGGSGSRGDHVGDVTVTVRNGDLDVLAGEGRRDHAQIGHGGPDTDNPNNNNQRADDPGNSGEIVVDVGGSIRVLGGGRDGDVVGALGTEADLGSLDNTNNARWSYGQIGHGGAGSGGNQVGDITVLAGSDIEVKGGSNPRGAYGMVGNGGYWSRAESHSGDITVVSENGDITVEGGFSQVDTATAPNGLDNTGHIAAGRESFAQIGNGGFDADAQGGNQNNSPGDGGHSGDIQVIAVTGSVAVRGGGDSQLTANNNRFRGLSAQIGNGGSFTDGDHTGDIRVAAGTDIVVNGGGASREAFGQIGHGGYNSDGDHAGAIDLDAGRDVVMQRGDGEFNPWSKIGNGAQAFGGRNNNGAGTRAGDITLSAGNDFNSTGGFVGHVDPDNVGELFVSIDSDVFLAVSRNDPFAGGPGNFITDPTTVLASSGFGVGSELRIFMPDPSANQIAEGTFINSGEFTRSPTPDGTRADEQTATEHTFTVGAFGEPQGDFTPEGPFPTNPFGLYNIFLAGDAPLDEIPDGGVGADLDAGFDFGRFFFRDEQTFEAFDRSDPLLDYDGFEGQAFSFAAEDAVTDEESDPDTGGFFLEELLDSGLGSRRGASDLEEERNEELRRRQNLARRQVGRGQNTFYVFNPSTNQYSSLRVFGVAESDLAVLDE